MIERRILFFLSAAETGSFTGAARIFNLSQAAISQQITALEGELGVQLFDRSGYRPVLTPAGKFFRDEAQKILTLSVELKRAVRAMGQGSGEERLRIGITGPMESRFLPHIISRFKEIHPDVSIDVKKCSFEGGVTQLQDGDLDLAFGITNDFRGKAHIRTTVLLQHQVCVICSKKHPWAGRESIDSSELDGQSIISFSEKVGSSFHLDFLESFRKDGITPNIVKQFDDLSEVIFAVKINQGIALVSREIIQQEDDVCMLRIEHTHHHAEFCLGCLEENPKVSLRDFIAEAVRYFAREKA